MKTPHLLAALLVAPMYLSAPAFAQANAGDAQTAEPKHRPPQRESATPEPQKLSVYSPEPASSGRPWLRQKTVGIAVMVLGGASLAAGLATSVTASVKYADLRTHGCTERECSASMAGDLASARTFANVSIGTLVGGLAAWTGGIFILATASAPSTMAVRVTPVLGIKQIGVNVSF